jgi:hypothetical protein
MRSTHCQYDSLGAYVVQAMWPVADLRGRKLVDAFAISWPQFEYQLRGNEQP